MFAKLSITDTLDDNGNIISTYKRIQKVGRRLPKWIDAKTGEVLGIDYFRKHQDVYPVETPTIEYDPFYQYLVETPFRYWDILDDKVVKTFTVKDYDVETLKTRSIQQLSSVRFEYETAGMSFTQSMKYMEIPTDRDSVSKFTGSYVLAQSGVRKTGHWKMINGFFSLTNANMIEIGNKIYDYVQACFEREGAITVAIAECETIDDLKDVVASFNEGWPENTLKGG